MNTQIAYFVTKEQPRTNGQGVIDPVTVFLEDFAPSQGRVTLVCWGYAWSARFGAMGNTGDRPSTIEDFLMSCDAPYLAGKLQRPPGQLKIAHERGELRWLIDIVGAVKDHLRTVRTPESKTSQR
jgi:hypothetical protein